VVGGRWVGPMGLPVDDFQDILAGLWSMGLACLKGAGQKSGDPVCLWIAGLAGFRGTVPVEIVQACAGLRGAAQQRLWMPEQALGAWPSRVEVVQNCAGVRA
jgi:hypothetical protein